MNLLCSVAVFPDFLDVSNHFYLSKMAALVFARYPEKLSLQN